MVNTATFCPAPSPQTAQNTLQHQQTARYKAICAVSMACFGGWLAFNSQPLNAHTSAQTLGAIGLAMLVLSWRLAPPSRLLGFLLLTAWHTGAGSAIPLGWTAFFGSNWGIAALLVWACLCALPALLFPARWFALALAGGSAISALLPVSMFSPWLGAFVFFPGWGWLGFFGAIGLLATPAIAHRRGFGVIWMVTVVVAALSNAYYSQNNNDLQDLPASAWAMETRNGGRAANMHEWMLRQANASVAAQDALQEGAKLIVTPEGVADFWNAGTQAFWSPLGPLAKEHDATLLLGLYRQAPDSSDWQSGLLDLASDTFYPAAVPMPLSMWHPWNRQEHMPMDFSAQALRSRIPTAAGQATYLVCYEEVLVWPLAMRMIGKKPDLLISSANQWFTTGTTAEAQTRSVELQKRLWGLPLLRAVNFPKA